MNDTSNWKGLSIFTLVMTIGLFTILGFSLSGNAESPPSTRAEASPDAPAEGPAQSKSVQPGKIGVVIEAGGESDKSFNEYTLKGAREAASRLGYQFTHATASSPAECEKRIETLIADRADLIITVGFIMGDATASMAKKHPNTTFAIIDFAYYGDSDPYSTHLTNVTSFMFAEDEAGYLAGVLAGCMSRTGTIGTVAGKEIPPVVKFVTGFQNGAQSVRPDIKTLNTYIPDFNDFTAGMKAGRDFIERGADLIFGVGGTTGNGGLFAAKEAGLMAIGVDVDQYHSYPDVREALVTSAVKNIDAAAAAAVEAFDKGELKAGIRMATLSNGGVGLAPYHDWENLIPSHCKTRVAEALELMQESNLYADL